MQKMPLIVSTTDGRSEILALCLQAIEAGQCTLEDCVNQYPDFLELEELLSAAAVLQTVPPVGMPAFSKKLLRQKVLAQYAAQKNTRSSRVPRSAVRGIIAACAVFVLLFFSGIGMTRAAQSALPGDTLYGLKRTAEQVRLTFASENARPDILAEIANTRLAEIESLTVKGQPINSNIVSDATDAVNTAITASGSTQPSLLAHAKHAFSGAQDANLVPTAASTFIFNYTNIQDNNSSNSNSNNGVGKGPSKTEKPDTPTETLTFTPSATESDTASPTSTDTATDLPTATATYTFTDTPTDEPTDTPTVTDTPTDVPTNTPTVKPSKTPRPTNVKPFIRPTQTPVPPTPNSNNGNGGGNGNSNGNGGGNGNGNGNSNGNGGGNGNGNGKGK